MIAASSFLMHVESPHVVRNLRQRLDKLYADLSGQLVLSGDWPDFKHRLGKLNGVGQAIVILDELEKQDRN